MRFFLNIATLLAVTAQSDAAFACACCADPGERFVQELEADAYEWEEFARLSAGGPAHLFLTACGDDCVEGISEIEFEYDVDWSLEQGKLRVVSGDPAGSILVPLSHTYTRFSVDTGPVPVKMHTDLYSEFRFTGDIEADGIFADAGGAKAELVLAGETNHCWMAENLTHWVLDVVGPKADFRLFGGLSAP